MNNRKKIERLIDIAFYFLLGLAFVIFPNLAAKFCFYVLAGYFAGKGIYLFVLYTKQKLFIFYKYISCVYFFVAIGSVLFGSFGQGLIQIIAIGLGIAAIIFGLGKLWITTKYIPLVNSLYRKNSKLKDILISISAIIIGIALIVVSNVFETAIFVSLGIILILGAGFTLYYLLTDNKKDIPLFEEPKASKAIEAEIIETTIEEEEEEEEE